MFANAKDLTVRFAELFRARVEREAGSTMEGVFQLEVEGLDDFHFRIEGNRCELNQGRHPAPTITIKTEPIFLENILAGRPVDVRSTQYRIALEKGEGAANFVHWPLYLLNETCRESLDLYEVAERAAATLPLPEKIERLPASAIREAVKRRHPVVFTGAVEHWPAMGFTPERLIAELGDFRLGGIPIATLFGKPSWIGGGLPRDLYGWFDDFKLPFLDGLIAPPPPVPMGPKVMAGFRPKSELKIAHRDPGDGYLFQIMGKKRVVLFDPNQKSFLYPLHSYLCAQPLWVDVLRPDLARHPRFARARGYEVELDKGDLLFLPTGWWHGVEELEPTFSVNYFVGYHGPSQGTGS
jgi:cupin-like protein